MWKVALCTTEQHFLLPAVQEQFARWTTDTSAWLEVVKRVYAGTAGVFVIGTSHQIAGLAVVCLPQNPFDEMPWVLHFQCQGGPKAKNLLIQALTGWIKGWGYDTFHAMNNSGKPDSVWARAFNRGGIVKKVASVVEFEIGKGNDKGTKRNLRRRRAEKSKLLGAGERDA